MSYMSTANLDHTHPSLPLQHLLSRTLFLIPSVNVCVIMFSFCLSKKSLILFSCVCLCVMDNMIESIISNTLFASYFPKPAVITHFQAPCTFIDNQLKQGVLPLKCFLFCLFVPLLICWNLLQPLFSLFCIFSVTWLIVVFACLFDLALGFWRPGFSV